MLAVHSAGVPTSRSRGRRPVRRRALAALAAPLSALQMTPDQSTTTQSMQPGLFNYLQLGASMFPR